METVKTSSRPIPAVHRNRMNPAEKWKADFQFRRKQSLTGSAKNLEAVNQTRMPVFLPVRLLGSDSGLRDLRSACSIAAAGNEGSTGGLVATISSKWASACDQQESLTGMPLNDRCCSHTGHPQRKSDGHRLLLRKFCSRGR